MSAATPQATPEVTPEVTRRTKYDDLPSLLTVQETATISNCTPWAIYARIHQGLIPYRRIGKKTILIPKQFFDPNRAQREVTA